MGRVGAGLPRGVLERYRIDAHLGAGGPGTVSRGVARAAPGTAPAAPADASVAIKALHRRLLGDRERARFERERAPTILFDDIAVERADVGPPFWPGKEHPGGTPELSFPDVEGGQFRIACEFSHFAYDDPIVAPGEPGGSHLHMFFGNTDANAYSAYDMLANSGSSTCNGQEINRTAYWVPALFDANGDVRIPMRAIVYYKGYGLANGASEVYPPGAAIIVKPNLHAVPDTEGGVAPYEKAINCSDQIRWPREPASNAMPTCSGGDGTGFFRTIEPHVKFPNCWNRQNPSNPGSWRPSPRLPERRRPGRQRPAARAGTEAPPAVRPTGDRCPEGRRLDAVRAAVPGRGAHLGAGGGDLVHERVAPADTGAGTRAG